MKLPFIVCPLLLGAGIFLFTGCAPDYCAVVATDSISAPVIEELSELNNKQQQALSLLNSAGDDPWLVVAELAFSDSDGDLGPGKVSVSLSGSEAYQLELSSLFGQRGLELTATSGKIALPFRLVPQVSGGSGSTVMKVGVALIDGAGQVSNCQSLDIKMDY